jgi:hypothetical protein
MAAADAILDNRDGNARQRAQRPDLFRRRRGRAIIMGDPAAPVLTARVGWGTLQL